MKQIYNPFLPLNEYIPDGEPHVFGDRVYHFGSHDKEGGYTFCMLDYVCYSAPVDDLTDWRYEGVIYRADQDPQYGDKLKYMFAPDVVCGNDGKYYLYYCMAGDYGQGGYAGPICVARADSPAGKYEYLGVVHYKDGRPMMKYVCFDPSVINDDGVIRVYYGTQYDYEEREDFNDPQKQQEYLDIESEMFGRSKEEILSYGQDSINGPSMVVLEDDMLTVKEDAKHIIPYRVKGTSFEAHPFFEAASMRKIGSKYYFIYSSWQNHELCYATSDHPDRDFTFGGTIVSNGDIGYQGRDVNHKLNMTGTTHGSIIEIAGQWYVFYHRLTHRSDYSRQACAEKISIEADGSIKQVEITSCGLNEGPLLATEGMTYPAAICCNLTNGNMPHGSNSVFPFEFPNVTNLGEERFIGNIEDGTLIGYKYFQFQNIDTLELTARIEDENNKARFDGPIRVDESCDDDENYNAKTSGSDLKAAANATENYFEIKLSPDEAPIGRIVIEKNLENCSGNSMKWQTYQAEIAANDGVHPLYLIYHGADKLQLKSLSFHNILIH